MAASDSFRASGSRGAGDADTGIRAALLSLARIDDPLETVLQMFAGGSRELDEAGRMHPLAGPSSGGISPAEAVQRIPAGPFRPIAGGRYDGFD